MKPQAALWALAGGALALAFLLGRGGRTPGQAAGEAQSAAPPGFEALDARVTQTDESGAVAYTATARRVWQASDEAPLRAEGLQIRQGSGGDWVLQAREGELPAGSGRLRLRGDVLGTADGLAKQAYYREGRRIVAEFTVLEQHIGVQARPGHDGAEVFADSVGLGGYRIDLHPSTRGRNTVDIDAYPFQIPLGALLPVAGYYTSPGAKTEFLYSFVALADLPDGAAGVFGLEEEAENIRGHLVDFEALMALVASGEVNNGPLVLTALWLQRERARLRGV